MLVINVSEVHKFWHFTSLGICTSLGSVGDLVMVKIGLRHSPPPPLLTVPKRFTYDPGGFGSLWRIVGKVAAVTS